MTKTKNYTRFTFSEREAKSFYRMMALVLDLVNYADEITRSEIMKEINILDNAMKITKIFEIPLSALAKYNLVDKETRRHIKKHKRVLAFIVDDK